MLWKEWKLLEKKQLRYGERNREERIKDYQQTSKFCQKNGSKNLVFIDQWGLNTIKTVFMPSQKKGKKFMVSKRANEEQEKN